MGYNRTLVLLKVAPHKGQIATSDAVLEELVSKECVGILRFGHHKQARSILVDAVNKARTDVATALFEQLRTLQVPRKGVHKRTVPITVAGVDNHTCVFVDQQKVFVLVENLDGDILRNERCFSLGIGHHDRDALQRLHFITRLDGFAVNEYVATIGSSLYAATATRLHMGCQIAVYAHQRLSLIDSEGKVFKELLLLVALLSWGRCVVIKGV